MPLETRRLQRLLEPRAESQPAWRLLDHEVAAAAAVQALRLSSF
jgi:hypothetical protein